jgi:hypothetical protein
MRRDFFTAPPRQPAAGMLRVELLISGVPRAANTMLNAIGSHVMNQSALGLSHRPMPSVSNDVPEKTQSISNT